MIRVPPGSQGNTRVWQYLVVALGAIEGSQVISRDAGEGYQRRRSADCDRWLTRAIGRAAVGRRVAVLIQLATEIGSAYAHVHRDALIEEASEIAERALVELRDRVPVSSAQLDSVRRPDRRTVATSDHDGRIAERIQESPLPRLPMTRVVTCIAQAQQVVLVDGPEQRTVDAVSIGVGGIR